MGSSGFEPMTPSVDHFPYLKRYIQDQFSHRACSSTWIMTVLRGAPETLLLRGKGPIFTILYRNRKLALKVWEISKKLEKSTKSLGEN